MWVLERLLNSANFWKTTVLLSFGFTAPASSLLWQYINERNCDDLDDTARFRTILGFSVMVPVFSFLTVVAAANGYWFSEKVGQRLQQGTLVLQMVLAVLQATIFQDDLECYENISEGIRVAENLPQDWFVVQYHLKRMAFGFLWAGVAFGLIGIVSSWVRNLATEGEYEVQDCD